MTVAVLILTFIMYSIWLSLIIVVDSLCIRDSFSTDQLLTDHVSRRKHSRVWLPASSDRRSFLDIDFDLLSVFSE